MIYIQTINDVEYLKSTKPEMKDLIKIIEEDLMLMLGGTKERELLLKMRLPRQEAIILLEPGDNVVELLSDPLSIEYVEKYKQGKIQFCKICKRTDHVFQLIYTLIGVHDEETENLLNERGVWLEGDYHV